MNSLINYGKRLKVLLLNWGVGNTTHHSVLTSDTKKKTN